MAARVAATGGLAPRLPTLVLLAFLLPAATQGDVYEVLVSGAGTASLNGRWTQAGIHNGRPEFLHVDEAGKEFEMFLHKTRENAWWNIQERLSTNATATPTAEGGGSAEYGPVLYGVNDEWAEQGEVVPEAGWDSTKYRETWVGLQPPPRLHVVGFSRLDVADCKDDACTDFFADRLDAQRFLRPEPRPTCPRHEWVRDVSDAEVETHQGTWNATGLVAVRNMLHTPRARWLRSHATEEAGRLHGKFWQASFWDPAGEGRARVLPRTEANAERIREWNAYERSLRDQHRYSYSFDRTTAGLAPRYRQMYPWAYDDVLALLQSDAMLGLIERITGRAYDLETYFISRYRSGNFLYSHSDTVETRRIAFVLHLTDNWRSEFGGLLFHLSEKDWTTVERVSVPQFNTLYFFDVSEERFLLPHHVTEVAQGISEPRIAVTGWYHYRGEGIQYAFDRFKGYDY